MFSMSTDRAKVKRAVLVSKANSFDYIDHINIHLNAPNIFHQLVYTSRANVSSKLFF